MKVIVGLGNPGPEYLETRHNVGFRVIHGLAQRWGIRLKRIRGCPLKGGQGIVGGHPVRLGLPQTSMNTSGEAVGCLLRRWKVPTQNLLVVCDDVSLPLGTIRLRGQGSDGGHRGLSSVLQASQTEAVPRLRIGVKTDRMGPDLTAYVLGRFSPSEKRLLQTVLLRAEEACEAWVTKGLSQAMNRFNKKFLFKQESR